MSFKGFFCRASDEVSKITPRKHTLPALLLVTLFLMVGMIFASPASAELYSRANGTMVYDSDLNITWLADANYAATQYKQSCGAVGTKDGTMDFSEATRWTKNLVYAGFSDWRLPKSAQPDLSCDRQTVIGSQGFNCAGSEMGHLFYSDINHGLGGKAGDSIINTHNSNYNLFRNISSFGVYWSSTDFSSLFFISRNFETRSGFSNAYSKSVLLNAWPVRDGDVGLKAKGEPAAMNQKCDNLKQ